MRNFKCCELIENINGVVYIVNENGYVTFISKSVQRVLGFEPDEVLGKHFTEFVPDEDLEIARSILAKIAIEKNSLNEYRLKSKTGTPRYVKFISTAVFEKSRFAGVTGVFIDISENKKAEEKLKFQSQLLNSVAEAVIATNLKGDITFWNNAAENIYGWRSDEVIGKNILDIVPSDNSQKEAQEIMFKLQKGESWSGEFETKRKDGSSFYIYVTDSPVFNDIGELTGIIGISSDITERKGIQEKLEKNEQLLSEAQQIAQLGSWELNHLTGELFWSDEIYRIFGLNPEIDKASFSTYLDYIHPDDRSLIDASFTNSLMKINDNYEVEYRITKKNTGEIKFVKGKWRNVKNSSGKVIKSIGTVQDITKDVLANKEIKKLSTAIEQSQVSVMITDTQGKIQYVNAKFRDVTGYNLEEVVNKNSNILKSGKQLKEFYEKLWSTILSGNTWQGELQNKKKNGELFWENEIISPMVDEQGRIINFIAVKEDITEKKRMIEELISSKEKAEESNRLKSHFLANMSHELRTPMVGILGFSEVLIEELTEPDHVDMASIIMSSGSRLMTTLNSILDLSRIEANKQDINIAPVNLVEIIKEAVHLYEPLIKSKIIYLKYSFPENNIYLNSDKDILYKIFNNLINNAVKYTHHGGIIIKLFIQKNGADKNIIVEINDTGIGIPEEFHKTIFEPFRQVSEGFSRKFEGAGLGLSITKRFIELLGGSITLKSVPGKGSTFKLTFPLTKVIESVNSPSGKNQVKNEISALNKISVLLVEDDPVNASVICAYLKDYLKIDHVPDGQSAINICSTKKYDAVLMDINLKGIDGVETLRQIRKLDSHYSIIPVIAITAYAMSGDREKFLSFGFKHYLSKPFDRSQLLNLLSAIFQTNYYS